MEARSKRRLGGPHLVAGGCRAAISSIAAYRRRCLKRHPRHRAHFQLPEADYPA